MPRRARLLGHRCVVAVLVAAFFGSAPAAEATWAVPGSGAALGSAAALAAPASPSVTASGLLTARTFTLRWQAPPPGQVPVTGYVVHRSSSLLGSGLISLGSCSGLTLLGVVGVVTPTVDGTTLSCTDVNVVAVGTVRYTVTPVYRRWVGPASVWSNTAT